MSKINTVLTPSVKELLMIENGDFLTADTYRFWRFHYGPTVIWCDIGRTEYVVKVLGRFDGKWFGKPSIVAKAQNQSDLLDRFNETCYQVLLPYTFCNLEDV